MTRYQTFLAVLAATTALSAPALGQATQETLPEQEEIETILVIGQASPVSTIDRAMQFQARQVRDVFSTEPSIDIAGGTRNGQRIFLRGVEGSNLNITVDGARQGRNLYNHRGGFSNIDPEFLRRVDIQAGPAAADQGFGALGGAIRFETIDAQDRLAPGQDFGAFGRVSFASAAEAQRVAAGAYGRLGDDVGVLAYVSATDFRDLRIGGGSRVPVSGGEDRNLLIKLSALSLGDHTLRVSYERNDASGLNFMQRGDYPYQLQPVDFRTRPPQDQSLVRDTYALRYGYNPSSDLIDIRIDAYTSRNDFFAPQSNAERFISDITGGDLRNTFRFALGTGRLETTIGADYFEDEGTASRSDAGTYYSTNRNTGLFVQNRYFSGPLALYAGVRHDDYASDYGPRKAQGNATSLNLGGEFTVMPQLTVFAGYGQAARGSGTLPLHFARNVQPGLMFNGSATGGLDPETSAQWEAGLRGRFADGLPAGGTLSYQLTAFRTEIEDAILYFQPGSGGLGGRPITNIFNFDDTVRFEGYEASLEYDSRLWSTALRYSHTDIANMPAEPQFIARTGAPRGDQWVWDSRIMVRANITAGYTLRHTSALTSVPAGQIVYIPKPGFTLHDIQLSWEPAALRGAALDIAVTNLTDERYVAHSTLTQDGFATEEAGRDIRLSLSYRY
ncbi:TonB-dependent receptor [Glycocaulis alkaliphilus]|uniref:TonB-dependent receptor n=1 Tax=Glycocaulis alkaliphilus TaxID=1434191 RepID=A0A3T0ED11_9PROT|nr:TonB-dependent receptor plug domain-containing protein [Glycocaulis alkaliphilus]AZU05196.1 TonB-dependent receptor [Glycocaulis alkaliphilus]GGB64489.1 TonB-dependent receptor [Glycocaulis alkaliphilus]